MMLARQKIRMNAADGGSVHNVFRGGRQDHLFVAGGCKGFARIDKAGAKISQVGAQQLSCGDLTAMRDRAGKNQGLVEDLADLRDKREGIQKAGMSSGPCADGDQSIHACFAGFIRMMQIDDIVEHQAAVGMDSVDNITHRAE